MECLDADLEQTRTAISKPGFSILEFLNSINLDENKSFPGGGAFAIFIYGGVRMKDKIQTPKMDSL